MSLRLYHSPGCWLHWCTKCGECIEARVKSKLLRRMREHQCGPLRRNPSKRHTGLEGEALLWLQPNWEDFLERFRRRAS
jgi:hypothetical protein